MLGKIVKTLVFPIKGMHGVEVTKTGIWADKDVGVLGDRKLAIYRKPGNFPTEWKPKGQFWVCMNREGMATDHKMTENDLGEDYCLNRDFARDVLMRRGMFQEQSQVIKTGRLWHLADNNKPYMSFLNLASVRDLEEQTGLKINPHRFRMNVWVDGLEPWAELKLVRSFGESSRYRMSTNNIQFGIDNLCERCKAIDQNPTSGEWDIKLQDVLTAYLQYRRYEGSPENNSHNVMGWYAIPENNGILRIGEEIDLG